MSGSSSQSNSTTITKRGFLASEINNFLQKGNTQSSNKEKVNFQSLKPTEKVQGVTTTTNTDSGFLGMGKNSETFRTNFGDFSGALASKDFTAEKLDSLVSSFMQREKQIQSARTRVGRKQLFMERT